MTVTATPAALRRHLLRAVGLAAVPLAGCGVDCPPAETRTVHLDLDELDTDVAEDTDPVGDTAAGAQSQTLPASCRSDPRQAESLLQDAGQLDDCMWVYDVELVSESADGRDCTYEFVCQQTCCGYGRPLLDAAGAPVKADAVPVAGWSDGPDRPLVDDLDADERATLGACWRDTARAEHSSVAGFHRFALDLLTHGAPPDLIARAQRAASQELRHALDAFTLASTYLGAPVGPGAMEMGGHAPVARSLAELAAWTARDGAVGETLAAWLAGRALVDATDPGVRAVLTTIVADETEHAALAWATLRWAIEAGGDEVREAVRAVFRSIAAPRSHTLPWSPRLAAHGVPSPAREEREALVAVDEVIRPIADVLLGVRLAA